VGFPDDIRIHGKICGKLGEFSEKNDGFMGID
jgi:hypothetical protein